MSDTDDSYDDVRAAMRAAFETAQPSPQLAMKECAITGKQLTEMIIALVKTLKARGDGDHG